MSFRILKSWVLIGLTLLGFSGSVFAQGGTGVPETDPSIPPEDENSSPLTELPNEFIQRIAGNLNPQDLASFSCANQLCSANCHDLDRIYWKKKADKLLEIMKKFGDFIPIPKEINSDRGEISPVGITQEFWVAVMGNNPSEYNKKEYCPDTYVELVIDGKTIGICPDFPVSSVSAASEGKKNSDKELFAELNRIFQNAGYDFGFRRQKNIEYYYADTEGGESPKLKEHANLDPSDPKFLGRYTSYIDIADKDPKDLTKPSPSGKSQPRSMWDNKPNAFGFRRSDVWEWTADLREMSSFDYLIANSLENEWEEDWKNYIRDPEYFWLRHRYAVGGCFLSRSKNVASVYKVVTNFDDTLFPQRLALDGKLRPSRGGLGDEVGPSRLVRTRNLSKIITYADSPQLDISEVYRLYKRTPRYKADEPRGRCKCNCSIQ